MHPFYDSTQNLGGNMARVISIINQKGGCGKTTTATNLAMGLTRKGHNVLAIDMDPQGHLTLGLGYRPDFLDKTILDLLESEPTNYNINEVKIEVCRDLFLIPANVALSTFEQKFARKHQREQKLSAFIRSIKEDFDYIIIDAPPSLGLLTVNSLLASSHSIIPIDTGFYALEGTRRLQDTINMLKKHTDHDINSKGLLTFFDKRSEFSKEMFKDVEQALNGNVFKTTIRRSVKFNTTQKIGRTVIEAGSRKGGIAFHDYLSLVDEVLDWTTNAELLFLKKTTAKTIVREQGFKEVLFKMDGQTTSDGVYIAGDFNGWNPTPLTKDKTGWHKTFNLEPGNYEYKFIVNGNWVLDPANDNITNHDGILSSLVEVF